MEGGLDRCDKRGIVETMEGTRYVGVGREVLVNQGKVKCPMMFFEPHALFEDSDENERFGFLAARMETGS